MTDTAFDYWSEGRDEADWQIPRKRLEPDNAKELLDGATGSADPARRLERLLALRRALAGTLKLNYAPGDEKAEALEALADRCSAALRKAADETAGPSSKAAAQENVCLDWSMARLKEERWDENNVARPAPPHDPPPNLLGPVDAGDDPRLVFAAGMRHRRAGETESAIRLLEAAHAAADSPAARKPILEELAPALLAAERPDALIERSGELAGLGEKMPETDYHIGMGRHYLAWGLHARGEHQALVEAARGSNMHLFQYGAVQSRRIVGVNYYFVAEGMHAMREWGEAAMLSQLSLRALRFENRWPSRADALLLMARTILNFKDFDNVQGIAERLLAQKPPAPDWASVETEARRLLTVVSEKRAGGEANGGAESWTD